MIGLNRFSIRELRLRKDRHIYLSAAFVILLVFVHGCTHFQIRTKPSHIPFPARVKLQPPVAKTIPKTDTIHGDIRIDEYFWFRERSNPEVIAYLNAENEYTEAMMKQTEGLQEQLYTEMIGRIKETDLSVPYKLDNYYYYSRTEEGKQYPIFCRKWESLDAEEEILVDQNELAIGHDYFEIGIYRISPDHKFLAYSVDTTGSELYTLIIKNLENNSILEDKFQNTGYSVAWVNNSKTIFYTTLDDAKRPDKLYRHTLGKDICDDTLVFHEQDEAFFLYVFAAKNKKYLLLETGSHTTSEVHYLRADNPLGGLKLIYPRQHEIEYSLECYNDTFIILTNENAKNYKLVKVSISNPAKKYWKEIIPHRDSVKIDGFDIFRNYLVIHEREKGLQNIRIINLVKHTLHYVTFPEPVYTIWPNRNPDFNSSKLRFNYTSLVTPRSVFDYEMDSRTRTLKKQYEVRGGYNAADYQSERIFARAQDGTLIPISMVYKKDAIRKSDNLLIMYGYGAYGESYDPFFSSNRLSLLNRGFIYAIAHVRGGGEMGKYWYEEGKLLNKMNTFTDFICCAEHLLSESYTSPEHLVISGGSAGGLLVGAVLNMKPELFKAAVIDVPFVDLINTMLDPSLPLTVLEYDEWGNPEEKTFYHYMKSYSPYDNVTRKAYPHMFITAGLNDTRVMYWEAAKWTAKLRSLKTDDNVLMIKTEMGTGHLGASGRYDYLRNFAFEYAFILHLFGINR